MHTLQGLHSTPYRMCAECRRSHREYQTARREQRKAEGRCSQCGREPEYGGGFCEACLAYFRSYFRLPGNRERNLDLQKQTRINWKEQGLCGRCGRHPPHIL